MVDIFYPENQSRARRVQELVDDITFLQGAVVSNANFMEKADKRIKVTMDKLMKEKGLATYSDLVNAISKTLDPNEKDKIVKLLKSFENSDIFIKNSMQVTMLVGLTAGISVIGLKVAKLVTAGILAATTKCYALGVKLVLTGNLARGKFILSETSRLSTAIVDTVAESSSLIRGLRTAATVFEVIGVLAIVIDGILLIVAAIEGDRQRTELQGKIREMSARRLICQYYEACALGAFSAHGQIESYLAIVDDPDLGEAEKSITLKSLGNAFIKSVNDNKRDIDMLSCWNDLHAKDTMRASWTSEDPSFSETQKLIKEMGFNENPTQ